MKGGVEQIIKLVTLIEVNLFQINQPHNPESSDKDLIAVTFSALRGFSKLYILHNRK